MTLGEIKQAIEDLTLSERRVLAEWFENFQSHAWDAQIASDAQRGKLDKWVNQARADFAAGKCTRL